MRRGRIGAFLIAAAVIAFATTLLPTDGTAQALRDLLPFGRTHRIAKLLQSVVNISTHKLSTDATDSSERARRSGSKPSGPASSSTHRG